jgi:hypothetical protein
LRLEEHSLPGLLSTCPFPIALPNSLQEFRSIDFGVAQCPLQSVTVNLVVKRKDYDAAVGMFHLNVTTLSMDFDEVEPLERGEDLLA